MGKVLDFFKKTCKKVAAFFKNVWNKVATFFKNIWNKVATFCKNIWNKFASWFKEKTKNVKWKEVWDKCTTGLLIFLMFTPFLILGYIFLWFIFK